MKSAPFIAVAWLATLALLPPLALAGNDVEHLSLTELRNENKQNIARLKHGMSKKQVLDIMGRKQASTKHDGPVGNPFRPHRFTGTDRQPYEVLFFYTDRHAKFGKIRDTNCTPVVLRQDRVVAIGHPAMRKLKGW
jgi:hypothetical protein